MVYDLHSTSLVVIGEKVNRDSDFAKGLYCRVPFLETFEQLNVVKSAPL